MKNPKILSISIAAYNVAATLRQCLNPFLNCGVLDALDIMVIDDGSTDETADIAREYVAMYPECIRLIQKGNGGWGSTVNTGIQNATGTYFRQLDGDDYYNPDNMQAYIDFLLASKADMILAPYIEFSDATGEILAESDCNPGCKIGVVYKLENLPNIAPFMHSMTIRTACIREHIHITEHCFYTDTEFVLKSCNMAHTVSFFDKPIYCYRRASTGQSMSLSGLEKHFKDQCTVIEALLDYQNSSVNRKEVLAIYDDLLQRTCGWQYLVFLYISRTPEHKKALISFDQMLKQKGLRYYNRIHIPAILLLRATQFHGYRIAAALQLLKDKRFDEEGRILY